MTSPSLFQIELAGISIGLSDRYGALKRHCKDYLTDQPPLFFVEVSDEEIRRAMALSDDPRLKTDPASAELVCVYRAICKTLPRYGVFLFHSAAIEAEGKAYLFSAPSGTGKTTHIKLWRECFGKRISMINGDKPLLRPEEDGRITVFSSPWAGKEGWQRKCSYPLGGLCFLKRGEKNEIRRLDKGACAERILKQILFPKDPEALAKALALADQLSGAVPAYELACTISEEAAHLSFAALTGQEE